VAQLIMEPAERALCRARVIILNEGLVDSNFREAIPVVRLQEEAARIAKHLWLEFPDARKRCFYWLQSNLFLASSNGPETDAIPSETHQFWKSNGVRPLHLGILFPEEVSACREESRFS